MDSERGFADGTRGNQLLSVSQVAELLQIPKSSVYRLVQNNKLPQVRSLNVVRIRQADLERFVIGG